MNVIDAIKDRRSIRKFLDREIDRGIIEKIIEAGILAPSGKNTQPWTFIVVQKNDRAQMLEAMKRGIEQLKASDTVFKQFLAPAEHTMKIMGEAPVTIFVLNNERTLLLNQKIEEKIGEMVDIQAIGAAIQNMLLAAMEYDIGSLWICDIFFAYHELAAWLKTDRQLIAAISFGYANEKPAARPRKKFDELVEWR